MQSGTILCIYSDAPYQMHVPLLAGLLTAIPFHGNLANYFNYQSFNALYQHHGHWPKSLPSVTESAPTRLNLVPSIPVKHEEAHLMDG